MSAYAWVSALAGIFATSLLWVLTEPLFGYLYTSAETMGVNASYLGFLMAVHDIFPILATIGILFAAFVYSQKKEYDEWR